MYTNRAAANLWDDERYAAGGSVPTTRRTGLSSNTRSVGAQLTVCSQARRLQLRMRSISDCQQVLAIFRRRGMEVRDQRPDTARPDTSASQHRLLTARTGSTPQYAAPHPRPNPFVMAPLEAGSYSQQRRSSPLRPDHGGVTANGETASTSVYFTRDERTTPRMAEPNRPSTAQIFQRHSNEVAGKDVTSSTPFHVPSLHAPGALSVVGGEPLTISSGSHPYGHGASSSGDFGIPLSPALLSSDSSGFRAQAFPPASSTTSPFPDTLEHEIPPPRELPFKRPESRRSGSDRSTSRPSTALELPPLRKPLSGSPTKSDGSHHSKLNARPSTGSPLKRTFDTSPAEQSEENISCPNVNSPPKRSPLEQPGHEKSMTPMDQLLARKRSKADTTMNTRAPRLNSLADAPHEVVSPPGTAVQSPVRREHLSSDDALRRDSPVGHILARPASTTNDEVSGLGQYAAQSNEDRAAALEEFMVSNLESNSFTTLCQDIENCWQRIALGL